jgi:4-hydroxythreonine-4-phosphate dehydrogenase
MQAPALLPIVVTQGDPTGIGLDITLQAWSEHRKNLAPFALIAHPEHVSERAKILGLNVPLAEVPLESASAVFETHLPVWNVLSPQSCAPCIAGHPDAKHAHSIIEAIEHSVNAVKHGKARALVTNPIAKYVLKETGFAHAGHTEFLAALCAKKGEPSPLPVMMIWSEALAVVPLTIHEPLKNVPALITAEHLTATAYIIVHAMRTHFGIAQPRIAVAGLNPHAGENGTMGDEENSIISPAIRHLQEQGMRITGPHSADTLFHEAARKTYDVALCMYHDQALIPVKTLAFDTGVNVTLGLPIIRTSPDHGTAFSLAGTGKANAASFIAALNLADRLSQKVIG